MKIPDTPLKEPVRGQLSKETPANPNTAARYKEDGANEAYTTRLQLTTHARTHPNTPDRDIATPEKQPKPAATYVAKGQIQTTKEGIEIK